MNNRFIIYHYFTWAVSSDRTDVARNTVIRLRKLRPSTGMDGWMDYFYNYFLNESLHVAQLFLIVLRFNIILNHSERVNRLAQSQHYRSHSVELHLDRISTYSTSVFPL